MDEIEHYRSASMGISLVENLPGFQQEISGPIVEAESDVSPDAVDRYHQHRIGAWLGVLGECQQDPRIGRGQCYNGALGSRE